MLRKVFFFLLGYIYSIIVSTFKCIDDNPSLCSTWRLGWIQCLIPPPLPLWKESVTCVYMDWWRIIFLFKTVDSFMGSGSLTCWVILVPFHFIVTAKLGTFLTLCFVKLCFALPVLVITEFISKSMAVLLNVMFMCVGIQCYDKYVCMCVWSRNCWMCFTVAYLCCCLLQTWRRWRCH